jgi:hypothetical protein
MRSSHRYMHHKECPICGNEGCDVPSLISRIHFECFWGRMNYLDQVLYTILKR